MNIRQEQPADYDKIYNVVQCAFASADHADGNEQDLVNALRKGNAYIPELSLVAEENGEIVGHIMFTKMQVGEQAALALAPLSVLPEFQHQQIGSKLIREGHRKAAELGYTYSIVLGSEIYYPRFGYLPALDFDIEIPDGIPAVNFMVCRLSENAPAIGGKVKYADEFGM